MTSCVETYRLATWRSQANGRLTIIEDSAVQYEAEVNPIDDHHVQLRLFLQHESVDLALEWAEAPSLCPDRRE